MNYTAECTLYASSYGEAIERFGADMDRIYGPKWKLIRSHAKPHLWSNAGAVLMWEWDLAAEWLGPVPNTGSNPDANSDA